MFKAPGSDDLDESVIVSSTWYWFGQLSQRGMSCSQSRSKQDVWRRKEGRVETDGPGKQRGGVFMVAPTSESHQSLIQPFISKISEC